MPRFHDNQLLHTNKTKFPEGEKHFLHHPKTMTEEIKPEIIKKTQEILGKFIKKPILTEKLLMKPPFRFLHDICTASMRETGFFEGVLSPSDCKAENIKDKDGKIAFLQKVIAAVEAANGIKLAVRPNKVVAGHEPARTNEFLQALGKALEKQVRNANVSKSKPDSNQTQTQAKTKTKLTKKPEKEETAVKKKTSSTKLSKTEKTDSKTKETKSRISSENNTPRLEEQEKKTEYASPRDQGKSKDKRQSDLEENEKGSKRREKSKVKTSHAPANDTPEIPPVKKTKEKHEQKENVKPEPEEVENKRPISARPGHRKPSIEMAEQVSKAESSPIKEIERPEPIKTDIPTNKPPIEPPKRPESSFLRHNQQNSREVDAVEDASPISRPVTSIRPLTGRPASARPAAPRIRDRGEIKIHEDVVKQSTGNVLIITDNKEGNEPEEDENVVTVEPENDLIADELEKTNQTESTNDQTEDQGEHGLLVEQILETQKELDQSRLQIVENKSLGNTEIEWKSDRNREATDREIKKLRLCIQTLTRSVNPLGKLLDFLQEDVDVMQKELIHWKEMNSSLDVQIVEERSLTEQSVEPLKVYLKELQQNIDHQLEQMTAVKANILRNDQKIQRLLAEFK